jgi:hypothetical protein
MSWWARAYTGRGWAAICGIHASRGCCLFSCSLSTHSSFCVSQPLFRCSAEDGEPSPLLPAWLELGLQPVHAVRSRGLRGGASPLLLPGGPWRQRGGGSEACSLLEPAEPPPGSPQLDRLLPSREVLERSEFLLPLDRGTEALYRRLLQA